MHTTSRPPFPSESEFDRVASRYFVVPALLWAAGLLAIVLSASVPDTAEPAAASARSEPATVAHGA